MKRKQIKTSDIISTSGIVLAIALFVTLIVTYEPKPLTEEECFARGGQFTVELDENMQPASSTCQL